MVDLEHEFWKLDVSRQEAFEKKAVEKLKRLRSEHSVFQQSIQARSHRFGDLVQAIEEHLSSEESAALKEHDWYDVLNISHKVARKLEERSIDSASSAEELINQRRVGKSPVAVTVSGPMAASGGSRIYGPVP